MDLFEQDDDAEEGRDSAPLAARMRPRTLDDLLGQDHILGPGKLLRRAVEADRLGSIILFGPPGCGKTSIAEVIAGVTDRTFERASGVLDNKAQVSRLLEAARHRKRQAKRETILFIDEVHRFNKAQQDILLPYLEDGSVSLVAATTHNPSFFINTPLVSRSQIFQLEPLTEEAVVALLRRAVAEDAELVGRSPVVDDDAYAHLAAVCEGDARRALNALEIAVLTTPPDADGAVRVTRAVAEESIQTKAVAYDRDGDQHYDTISAFIKSVRGSAPDAAVYWLAKMLAAGEDPRFVARRLVILASEDIGNADPRGLGVATAAMQAVDFVGMPEARIVLAQATTYLATAPKSNAAYMALERAAEDVANGRTLPVPRHLRSSAYAGAEALGHTGYKYAHDYDGHVVDQEYLPEERRYYQPTDQGYEATIAKRLQQWDALRAEPGEPLE